MIKIVHADSHSDINMITVQGGLTIVILLQGEKTYSFQQWRLGKSTM